MSQLRLAALALLITAGLLACPSPSPAQLVLVSFDDFESSSRINPDLWHGDEGLGSGANGPNAEASRRIVGTEKGQQLELSHTVYGNTDNNGTSGGGSLQLRFNNPGAITAYEAVVTVVAAKAQVCPTNATSSRARAQIQGNFFNNGSSTGAGDETGDVYAGFQKALDNGPGGTSRPIEAFIFRCDTSNCSTTTTLASATLTATWADGQRHKLRIEWDSANDRFRFFLNAGKPSQELVDLAYTEPDNTGTPLGFTNKQLRTRNTPADCTGTRRRAAIQAWFDKVKVNP